MIEMFETGNGNIVLGNLLSIYWQALYAALDGNMLVDSAPSFDYGILGGRCYFVIY
jgi:hypothetical protein